MKNWRFSFKLEARSWGLPFGLRWGWTERNFIFLCFHFRFFDKRESN